MGRLKARSEREQMKKRDYWALGLAVPTACFLVGTVRAIQAHNYGLATTLGLVTVACVQITISAFHGED